MALPRSTQNVADASNLMLALDQTGGGIVHQAGSILSLGLGRSPPGAIPRAELNLQG